MNLIPTFCSPSKENPMQSHSKAGRSLLLLLLALGVASGCGGSTLPEATDTSAPTLEDLTQAQNNQPKDNGAFRGGWIGRPKTLGSCNPQQTKAAFEGIDTKWAFERREMSEFLQCKTGHLNLDVTARLALLTHLGKGAGCLGGSGSGGQDPECQEWNSYKAHEQVALHDRLVKRANWGETLNPAEIYKEAMGICRNSTACALWIAYRQTNKMSGTAGEQYPKTLGAMPNMRSSCSPITGITSRGGIYYHFFLVALFSYTYGPGIGTLTTVERFASMDTAPGDPDKAGSNWEGVKMGTELLAAGLDSSVPVRPGRCLNANADTTSVVIGEVATVPVKANDTSTPRSLLGSLGISVSGVPAGLSVSVGSTGFSASKPGLTGSPVSKSGLTGAQAAAASSLNVSSVGPPKLYAFSYRIGDDKETSNTTSVDVDVKCPPNKPDWDPAVSQCTDKCGDCESEKYCDTGSGTPTCKCSPESPDWNPTTQKCEPPLTCGGGTSASGGDEGYSKTLELGATSGTISVSYSTYTQKDRIRITYGGATLLDSGCVGESKTIDVPYSGNSTQATVVVEPNCEGGSGTAWDFSFGCAR